MIADAEVSKIVGTEVRMDPGLGDCVFGPEGPDLLKVSFKGTTPATKEELDSLKSGYTPPGAEPGHRADPSDLQELPAIGDRSLCFAGHEQDASDDYFFSYSAVLVEETLTQVDVEINIGAPIFSSLSVEKMTDICESFQELVVSKRN